MKRQLILTLAATVLLTTPVVTMTPHVLAEETATSTTTSEASGMDRLQINAVAIGNALTSEQETYTLDKLGIKGETPIYKTTGADLVKYLPGNGFTDQWAVYSSVRMQTLDKNDGITVDIATPENITKITAAQYQNAALTAGISDAKLTIASAVPIDGSGALAGVYKIVEESGGIIDQKRVDVAQDEMDVLATITEQNKDKEGYSDEALNKAQEEAKTTLAEQTAKGENLTQADIKQAVEDALANNGLKDIVTSDQLNELTTLMDSMKENNIFSDFVNQLDLSNAKQQIEEKSKGLWTKIKDFFSGIWSSITGMFGNKDEQPTQESIVQ